MKPKRGKTKADRPDVKADPSGNSAFFEMNTAEIAEMLRLAARTVRELRQHHDLPATGRDSYDARLVYRWAESHIKGTPRPACPPGEPTQPGGLTPRDELAVAQRLKVELETSQLRATLLPRDMVDAAMTRVGAIINSEFVKLATGPLVAEIAAEPDPDRIQSRLFAASRESRSAIAQAMLELSERIASGEAFGGGEA